MREVKPALLPGEAEDADESPQGVALTVVVLRHFEAMLSAWGTLTLEPSPAAAKHQSEVSLAWGQSCILQECCLDQPQLLQGNAKRSLAQHIIVVALKLLLDAQTHCAFWLPLAFLHAPSLHNALQLPLNKTFVSVIHSCDCPAGVCVVWPMAQLHLSF